MSEESLEVTYGPGSWAALAGDNVWLLVDLPLESAVLTVLWPLVRAGASVDRIMDILISSGINEAPPFALLHLGTGERRALVRGIGEIQLRSGETFGQVLKAEPGTTWVDTRVTDDLVEAVLASAGFEPPATRLPMSAGVTAAARVDVEYTSTSHGSPIPAPAPPEPEPHTPPLVVAEAATPAAAAKSDGSYDFLFGATQRPPDLVAPVGDQAPSPVASPVVARPDTGTTQDWNTVTGDGTEGLIDSVPWMTAAPASASEPTPTPVPVFGPSISPGGVDQVPESEVHTINRAQLLAEAASLSGPTVHAVRCPAGHHNSVHASQCRACGAAISEQQSAPIPRPALGVLKLSTGDVVTLDRGVIFGRAPEPRPGEESDRPNVVRLASPNNDLSRNHAEVFLDGWNVYVKDLGSTNGTMITLPGQEPVRLRPHDPFAIEPHAVVNLADEISMTFEVPQ